MTVSSARARIRWRFGEAAMVDSTVAARFGSILGVK